MLALLLQVLVLMTTKWHCPKSRLRLQLVRRYYGTQQHRALKVRAWARAAVTGARLG